MGSSLFLFRLFSAPWEYAAWVVVVTFSICVHEYSHAWTAMRRGDSTAADAGHLTLDPTVQMGLRSLVFLLVVGMAWGTVPVSPARLRRSDRALVSLSGPAANLALMAAFAAVCALLLRWGRPSRIEGAPWLLAYAARANATLFLLNLLPLPSLDGWGALETAIPALEEFRLRWGPQLSFVVLAAVFLTPLFSVVWSGGDWLATNAVLAWLRLLGTGA